MTDAATFIDLEFDTAATDVAQFGDIAASLVSLDELLRDLASIAAYRSAAEFRKIEIVGIEMRSPLKIRLSVFAIAPEALNAFQEICRDIIRARDAAATDIDAVLIRYIPSSVLTDHEAQRLHGHVAALRHATIPLKRVRVTKAD